MYKNTEKNSTSYKIKSLFSECCTSDTDCLQYKGKRERNKGSGGRVWRGKKRNEEKKGTRAE